MRTLRKKKIICFVFVFALIVFLAPALFADTDPAAPEEAQTDENSASDQKALGQFPAAETAPLASTPQAAVNPENPSGIDFPKVKTAQDEELAKRFSWWPTDAKPAPVKDEFRDGYWWWPQTPGEARPWGNQGFIYVRKIIFDYKSSEGEMKPSLVIKKILKNVRVYFDYDKSDIREDTRNVLTSALSTLERNPNTDILITGNADVRGSEKYNEKLGESRAAAVKQFMTDHDLSEDRIKILSRGKLDALAPTNDLVGMQKDRNAQFMIAEVEEVMIPASKASLYQDKIIEEKKELEGDIKVSTKDYVIEAGDTLWKIAQREYGNGMQWKRLYEFNKDVISNPDRPKKGTRIRIPIE